MPKLNTNIRREILGNLLRHAFLQRYERRQADMIHLADEVYDEALDVPARRLLESLPPGWVREESGMPVRFGGQQARVNFCGDIDPVVHYKRKVDIAPSFMVPRRLASLSTLSTSEARVAARRRLPDCLRSSGTEDTLSLRGDHPLAAKWLALETSVDSLLEEANRAMAEAWRALVATTTAEKLVEAWPEAAPHVPPTVWAANAKSNLPAIRTEDLNKSLRLP